MPDDLTPMAWSAPWLGTARALDDVQCDLIAPTPAAPTLMILVRPPYDEERPAAPAGHDETLWAYIGRSIDWYFGAEGGFALRQDYVGALLDIAEQTQGAIVDGLLGDLAYWPHCPHDDRPLVAVQVSDASCGWRCDVEDAIVAIIGELGRVGRVGLEPTTQGL